MSKVIKMLMVVLLVLLVDVIIHFGLHILPSSSPLWENNLLMGIIIQSFMFLTGLILFKAFTKAPIMDIGYYRKDRVSIKKYLLIFAILAPLGLSLTYLLVYLFDPFTWEQMVQGVLKTPKEIVMNIVTSGIIPGIAEETLYRGAILGTFFGVSSLLPSNQARSKTLILVLISSIVFTLAHLNLWFNPFRITYDPYQLLTALILGSFEAFVFMKTRNLFGSIIIHSGWNILSLLSVQLLILLF